MNLSENTWRERALLHEASELLHEGSRYLDFALELKVIDRAADGAYSLPGKDDGGYVLLSTHKFGGKLDTVSRSFVGPAEKYLTLHVTAAQWVCLSDPAVAKLVFGGEGSGKSVVAAIWTLIQIITHRNCSAGVVAPVQQRVDIFVKILLGFLPTTWYRHRVKAGDIFFPNGVELNCRGVLERSAVVGSRISGYSWAFCVADEVQAFAASIHNDVEARGRVAKEGKYKRFSTATPQDSYSWREYAKRIEDSNYWATHKLIGPSNLFTAPEYWERLREEYSWNEYRRRVYAENLPSDSRSYNCFARARNIISLPDRAIDVTYKIHGYKLIIGHDPGNVQHTSILCRRYSIPRADRPVWVAAAEVVSPRTTTDQHAYALEEKIERMGVEPEECLILVDPGHRSINDYTPEEVCSVFHKHCFDAERAIVGSHIRVRDRVDLLNSLFYSGAQKTHLYLLKSEVSGRCLVPHLLESLEQEMLDFSGRPESVARKGSPQDKSHGPSALAYALYAEERPAGGQETVLLTRI